MPTQTGNNRGAKLDFISERISDLVKKALADSSEHDVDLVRRTLESEQVERGASNSATQLLAQVLRRVTSRVASPPEVTVQARLVPVDDDLKDEVLAYDGEAAQAFRAMPSPDIAFKELLSSDQMAERIGVTRPTVHRRLRSGELIGWTNASARTVFPADQLDEFNRPAPKLAQVVEAFVDPQVAWLWLSQPSELLEGDLPIERLKAARSTPGYAQAVIDAALAKSLGAFG